MSSNKKEETNHSTWAIGSKKNGKPGFNVNQLFR